MLTDFEKAQRKLYQKIEYDLFPVKSVSVHVSSKKTRCKYCDRIIPAKTIHLTEGSLSYKGYSSYRGVHYKCYIKAKNKELKIINKYKKYYA